MNVNAQYELMKLVIMWTLVGAFTVTVIITLLAYVGVIVIPNKKQQNRLFYIIIVQVAVACVGVFTGQLRLSPAKTAETIQQPLKQQNDTLTREKTQIESEKTKLARSLEDTQRQYVVARQMADDAGKEKQATIVRYKAALEQVDELKKMTAAPPDQSGELKTQIADLTAQLQAVQKDRDEAKAALSTAVTKSKQDEATLQQLEAQEKTRKKSSR